MRRRSEDACKMPRPWTQQRGEFGLVRETHAFVLLFQTLEFFTRSEASYSSSFNYLTHLTYLTFPVPQLLLARS